MSSAIRDSRRIVVVTINAPNDWQDHAALLEQGFSGYSVRQVVKKGETVGVLSVEGGMQATVEVLAGEDFFYALAADETPRLMLPGTGFVYSPVTEGADAGYAYVLLQGKAVGKIPVVYGQTVEQLPEKERSFLEKLFGGQES